uniref:Uncharacterized protein n=1 Tax=Mycena chlorophos TaxID=658473 RepID=A0ABQ0LNH0_MYCCL|nr:predicted protein [Mycena chlorophos]
MRGCRVGPVVPSRRPIVVPLRRMDARGRLGQVGFWRRGSWHANLGGRVIGYLGDLRAQMGQTYALVVLPAESCGHRTRRGAGRTQDGELNFFVGQRVGRRILFIAAAADPDSKGLQCLFGVLYCITRIQQRLPFCSSLAGAVSDVYISLFAVTTNWKKRLSHLGQVATPEDEYRLWNGTLRLLMPKGEKNTPSTAFRDECIMIGMVPKVRTASRTVEPVGAAVSDPVVEEDEAGVGGQPRVEPGIFAGAIARFGRSLADDRPTIGRPSADVGSRLLV